MSVDNVDKRISRRGFLRLSNVALGAVVIPGPVINGIATLADDANTGGRASLAGSQIGIKQTEGASVNPADIGGRRGLLSLDQEVTVGKSYPDAKRIIIPNKTESERMADLIKIHGEDGARKLLEKLNSKEAPQDRFAILYQLSPFGGSVAWFDAPSPVGSDNYWAEIRFKDVTKLDEGVVLDIQTSEFDYNATYQNALFTFLYDLSGYYWEVQGGADNLDASVASATYPDRSYSDVIEEPVRADYRDRVFLPFLPKNSR